MSKSGNQTIEELQARFKEFSDQRIKIETQREAAVEKLEELKAKARDAYGSDDVKQLEKMLKEMKAANESKRQEYQDSLDKIEKELGEINERFAAVQEDV